MRAQPDRFRWRFATALLALIAAVACQPGATAPGQGAGSNDQPRFSFLRGHQSLVRIDTSTGAVSMAPDNGDGGWTALGNALERDGHTSHSGRYALFTVGRGKGEKAPMLLRVDRTGGDAWVGELNEGMTWVLFEAPVAEILEGTEESSEEPNTDAESATSAAELPVMSREAMMTQTGTTESEKLAVVVQALQMQELSVEVRVWAATQLAVFESDLAVPPLLATLDDEQPEVVVAAIASLQQLGDPTTIPKLQAMASHPDPQVRKAVQEAIHPGP